MKSTMYRDNIDVKFLVFILLSAWVIACHVGSKIDLKCIASETLKFKVILDITCVFGKQ